MQPVPVSSIVAPGARASTLLPGRTWVPGAVFLAGAATVLLRLPFVAAPLSSDEGGFLVLEVNSMPSWSGLQGVTGIDIAATIVDAFLAAVGAAQAGRHASEPAMAPC